MLLNTDSLPTVETPSFSLTVPIYIGLMRILHDAFLTTPSFSLMKHPERV